MLTKEEERAGGREWRPLGSCQRGCQAPIWCALTQRCENKPAISAVCQEEHSRSHKSKMNKAAERQSSPSGEGLSRTAPTTAHQGGKRHMAPGGPEAGAWGGHCMNHKLSGLSFPVWEPSRMSSQLSPSKEHLGGHFCSIHTDLHPSGHLGLYSKARTGETPEEKLSQGGAHCGRRSMMTPGTQAGSLQPRLRM